MIDHHSLDGIAKKVALWIVSEHASTSERIEARRAFMESLGNYVDSANTMAVDSGPSIAALQQDVEDILQDLVSSIGDGGKRR